MFLNASFPVYVENFDEYYEDYKTIADFALVESNKLKFLNNKNAFFYTDFSNGIALYNSETDEPIILNKPQQYSLEKVSESFIGELGKIRIQNNRVSFINAENYSAIVYSLDDSKPEYIGLPDENVRDYYVKKLKSDWYSIAER